MSGSSGKRCAPILLESVNEAMFEILLGLLALTVAGSSIWLARKVQYDPDEEIEWDHRRDP